MSEKINVKMSIRTLKEITEKLQLRDKVVYIRDYYGRTMGAEIIDEIANKELMAIYKIIENQMKKEKK